MSDTNTGLTSNVYRQFINTVAQLPTEAFREKPEVAGWLSVGLSLAAEGATTVGDSAGSTVAGP